MIVKRTGNGQTECVRCKEKGKWALNWDSFLYTFNDKPYCFDCLMEMLEEKENIIKEVRKELKGWEKLDLDNLLVVIRNIEKILDKGE